ncbi:MAG TPA: sigma 54-interacting transcriptional regulator [Polyangia bacterium]
MTLRDETIDQSRSHHRRDGGGPPEPGLVKLFSGDAPSCEVLTTHGPIVIGRDRDCQIAIDDARASRRHAELTFDGARWSVRDLGSRNGTFLDGERVTSAAAAGDEAVLSIGNTLFLVAANVTPLGGAVTVENGVVIGPRLRPIWQAIDLIAEKSKVLHVVGETGTGKEQAARRFHAGGKRAAGPFVAVNCAAVPPLIAERLFFGARRGAYSGADADAEGYLAAADGGTLFLDEVGDLSPDVQPKLLRAIETGELLPLGAAHARKLEVAVCSATHVDLRGRINAGSFRSDLYFRLGQPALALPPLRARREEIPWIIDVTLGRLSSGVRAHASLVEAALLRPWPGNTRELINAVTAAAHLARGQDNRVMAQHLGEGVGTALGSLLAPNAGTAPAGATAPAAEDAEVARIRQALEREHGNVTRAAEALGLHRTQLRRLVDRHGIDVKQYRRSPDRDIDNLDSSG